MLTLRKNEYEFDTLLPTDYKRVDYHCIGSTYVEDLGYITTKYVDSALAILMFNDISFKEKVLCVRNTTQNTERTEEQLKQLYQVALEQSEDRLTLLRIYTNDIEYFKNKVNKDIFCDVPEAIQQCYTKCLSQVKARENIDREINTLAYKSRTGHTLLLISNISDDAQASDFFLTIGLLPGLFPDFKEKFNELELNFCRTLAVRSQIKRISNVQATAAFLEMINCEKYIQYTAKVKIKQTVESLVTNKIALARDQVETQNNRAESALQNYEHAKRAYFEAQEILNEAEQGHDQLINEMLSALEMEGIVDVSEYAGTLTMLFKTPVTFFNIDEAEIIIKKIGHAKTRQLFTDVFLDQKYKMNIGALFNYSINRNTTFQPPGALPTDLMKRHQCLYNPHLQYFSCLGDYRPQLVETHAKGNLLLFNNLALASTKSINFRDGVVMGRWIQFFDDVFNRYTTRDEYAFYIDLRILETEDGKLYSLRDVYETDLQDPATIEPVDSIDEEPF